MKQKVLVFSTLIYSLFSCRDEVAHQNQVQHQTASSQSDCCSDNFSSSYDTINHYHVYPNQSFDTSCAANGATVSISVEALDIPNRFNVYDASNNLIAQSGWLGNAKYQGSWGQTLSTVGSTTLTFKKNATRYYLKVETQTPPNITYSPTIDHWSATISCLN